MTENGNCSNHLMMLYCLLLSRPFIIAQHFPINIEDTCKAKPHGMSTRRSVLPPISLVLTNLPMQMAKTSPNWIFDKCHVLTALTGLIGDTGERTDGTISTIFDRLRVCECECAILHINCKVCSKFELKREIKQS